MTQSAIGLEHALEDQVKECVPKFPALPNGNIKGLEADCKIS